VVKEPVRPKRENYKSDEEFRTAQKKYSAAVSEYVEYQKQAEKKPLTLKLAKGVGHNQVAINMVWTLLTGFLVMFMQAGFAMVLSGLSRAKNTSHTMAMSLMIYPLSLLGFYACGFAFMYGGSGSVATLGGSPVMDGLWSYEGWNLLGTRGFFLSGNFYDVTVYSLFFLQCVFLTTAATITPGATLERWRFAAFCLYGLAMGTVIYPIYGNWVWGGGWCSQLGSRLGLGHGTCDYGGSSVVHLQGGVVAFWFALFIRPRLGKFGRDGRPRFIPPHNVPLCVIGTFVMAFGWFGFNAGSSLSGTDLRISVTVVNTMLASATGALSTALWLWWIRRERPETTLLCRGMLAGLVSITASCAYVNPRDACIIGAVAGILVIESMRLIERVLKVDDASGVISVHGVNGLWGLIALGLFAEGTYPEWGLNHVPGPLRGYFYGDIGQLKAQLIGAGACIGYVSVVSIVLYALIDLFVRNRVSREVELEGLDRPETGVAGYSGVVLENWTSGAEFSERFAERPEVAHAAKLSEDPGESDSWDDLWKP
jgi:Amt family ammonium transporter